MGYWYIFIFCSDLFVAGQDRFRTVNPAFYRGADGIVLVYDVTQTESFNRIEGWFKEAVEYAKDDAQKVLIGNKADLPSRQVSEQMGRDLASRLGNIPFLETSAKTSTNVETAFLTIANDLVKLNESKPVRPVAQPEVIPIKDPDSSKNSSGGGDACPCS